MKIEISEQLSIDDSEIRLDYVQASGPGGQNVNKVATSVQLRFDVQSSPSLPEEVRQRLRWLAGKRMTAEGILMIEASRYRTQEQNRQDALARLVALLRQAAQKPKVRRKTQVPLAAKKHRLEAKRRRRDQKRLRGRVPLE